MNSSLRLPRLPRRWKQKSLKKRRALKLYEPTNLRNPKLEQTPLCLQPREMPWWMIVQRLLLATTSLPHRSRPTQRHWMPSGRNCATFWMERTNWAKMLSTKPLVASDSQRSVNSSRPWLVTVHLASCPLMWWWRLSSRLAWRQLWPRKSSRLSSDQLRPTTARPWTSLTGAQFYLLQSKERRPAIWGFSRSS